MDTFELHDSTEAKGQFVDLNGDRYYKISDVDSMSPFFISLVSASDHWLFISSTGALSAGRIRPENALFPYRSVDHIHENAENTGSKTIVKVMRAGALPVKWEPFNPHHDGLFDVQRNLYKNVVGDSIVFEELNQTLGLSFQYSWRTSERFGFVRESRLISLSDAAIECEILDGIQNILPSGAPLAAQQSKSALVDAYKWNQRVEDLPLATYSMYAKLSDRAEPAESLRATAVFSLTGDEHRPYLSSQVLTEFRKNQALTDSALSRGVRGAYFVHQSVRLEPLQLKQWLIVADIDQTHSDLAALKEWLMQANQHQDQIQSDCRSNQAELLVLMNAGDAAQKTACELTDVHHYANVLFNTLRGGAVVDGYQLDVEDVKQTFATTNQILVEKHARFFAALPHKLTHPELVQLAKATEDPQLLRLAYEYLPLTFGRRHGDPSRPWNHYEIKVRDELGNRLLSYQGNWRDIFQNWEALALSYPNYLASFIAKFVNASTVDGYNPYRITKDGVDWEVLEPEDPWSNIGYWGDHQIIYLLKFLELADKYQGDSLNAWLTQECYSYANVPYEIAGVEQLLKNPKDTVSFNQMKHDEAQRLSVEMGSDGRLVLDPQGAVYQVNLIEKLLVPLLAKMSNFVIDGGIWLNTQRPEWNDANNAIVGNGLSMVTLYYMRRYVTFLQGLVTRLDTSFELSSEVAVWLIETLRTLQVAAEHVAELGVTSEFRQQLLLDLANSAERYRNQVYRNGFSGKTALASNDIHAMLDATLALLDHTIKTNKRSDGLYNAYNIISFEQDGAHVAELYPMLEGQVAALSSGALSAEETIEVLDALFASDMYRADQQTFMLYPDRELRGFMAKNQLDEQSVQQSCVAQAMLESGDSRILNCDAAGLVHFHADFENAQLLAERVEQVKAHYPQFAEQDWQQLFELYETTFSHRAFTGRSGTMFGYEGLGCIYWHMVSKLLLAVQENYQRSLRESGLSEQTHQLNELYYRVREGIGFNKSPQVYGAFPTDPYSHTPKHAGAQQPGMTGQVKEEVLTRFAELGIWIEQGSIAIIPNQLKRADFVSETTEFAYHDVLHQPQQLDLAANSLAFTYCQVPFVYRISDVTKDVVIQVELSDGTVVEAVGNRLSYALSQALFARDNHVRGVYVVLPSCMITVN
ncbi:hypothetical protein D1115_15845 [Vibrio alfacsensis]|uniref:Cellobiose phosphorylase n=1 Tax=Vibrio alfacsensis TaxID=1074311 RepID=A0ABM6YXA5_9VIBR|nr:hypothetical protein [Vibrio alfacsensis]AXY02530.1 hypothetical protein D1115_15845 [Vibrio alfacsensis]